MNLLMFQDEIQRKIMEHSSELNGEIRLGKIHKNNQMLNGISYIPENSDVGMTFYVEDLYRGYKEGESIENIIQQLMSHMKEKEKDIGFVKEATYNAIRAENIIPVLIGRKGNEKLLSEIPHVPFEDLEIIFKIPIPEISAVGNVTNSIMEEFGLNPETLLETAKNNAAYKDAIQTVYMDELLQELLGKDAVAIEEPQGRGAKMMVITNANRYWGAASILDKETMAAVSEKLGDDLYILPSSIHECIVVPKSDFEVTELRMMVRDVNATQVEPQEVLSNEIFMFDSYTLEVKQVQDTREKTKDAFVPRLVFGMS